MTEQLLKKCAWDLKDDKLIDLEKDSYVVIQKGDIRYAHEAQETEYWHLNCWEAMTAP